MFGSNLHFNDLYPARLQFGRIGSIYHDTVLYRYYHWINSNIMSTDEEL